MEIIEEKNITIRINRVISGNVKPEKEMQL